MSSSNKNIYTRIRRRLRVFRSISNLVWYRWFPHPVDITGGERDYLVAYFERTLSDWLESKIQVRLLHSDLQVDLGSSIERPIGFIPYCILQHYVKSPLANLIRESCPHDSVSVDIGANLGFYSLIARYRGVIPILFEPEPRHVAFLQRNRLQLGTVFPLALSDHSGTASFYGMEDNSGASSLIASEGAYTSETKVEIKRFDEMLEQLTVSPANIKLIKIDVEGHEECVLAGMEGFFSAGFRPKVFCEVRGEKSGRNPNSYIACCVIMATWGYEPFVVIGEERIRLQKYSQDKSVPQVFDILFIPQNGEPAHQ